MASARSAEKGRVSRSRKALWIVSFLLLTSAGILLCVYTPAFDEIFAVGYMNGNGYAWAEGYSPSIPLNEGRYKLVATGGTSALEANTAFSVSVISDNTYETAVKVAGVFYLKEAPVNIGDSEYFSRMTLPDEATITMIGHRAEKGFNITDAGYYSIKYTGLRAEDVLQDERVRLQLMRRVNWEYAAMTAAVGIFVAAALVITNFGERKKSKRRQGSR